MNDEEERRIDRNAKIILIVGIPIAALMLGLLLYIVQLDRIKYRSEREAATKAYCEILHKPATPQYEACYQAFIRIAR